MTLGVRVIAFDETGRVFLVRHTYVAGWHLPGGGVDPGETVEEAVRRELREEGHLDLPQPPALLSVHFNDTASRRDHVFLYRCEGAVQTAPKPADREIAESGFFALDSLPAGITAGTLRRLAEARGEVPSDPYW